MTTVGGFVSTHSTNFALLMFPQQYTWKMEPVW